jgi:hypothetical protein
VTIIRAWCVVIAAAIVIPPSSLLEVEEKRSIGALPAHLAASFEEVAACQTTPGGEFIVFDRRAHAVFTVARGADRPTKIVDIGGEPGRILMPTAFDSAPDGSFVVADTPHDQQRLQFFLPSGTTTGGFTMPGRGAPQVTIGTLYLSGLASLEYTGKTVLISQPENGALVIEYLPTGTPLRTFGELRPTGQERDPAVHAALNLGIVLLNPNGGYYFVFLSGVPAFRKYDADGKLVFERAIQGIEMDPYVGKLPTTWPRRAGDLPLVPAMLRTAAVDSDGNLWISLVAPYTYVYDASGDKRHIFQFRAAGIVAPTHFFFTKDRKLLVTPGCYTFNAD